ncbi:hypothetical protein DFJ74DRAFT_86059 [Hyaloraphidium curvatum]|nr:hypothetical protein DFJ74DRAFT_86059 [Hyaloraphidium curvatum]
MPCGSRLVSEKKSFRSDRPSSLGGGLARTPCPASESPTSGRPRTIVAMSDYADDVATNGHYNASPEKNGEKRRRVTQACDLCSEQRAKCDSMKPCARCEKRGTECTYLRQPKRRGPPKGTANSMRERLSRLEQIYGAVKAEEMLMMAGVGVQLSQPSHMMNGGRAPYRGVSVAASAADSVSGDEDGIRSPDNYGSPAPYVRDIKPSAAALAAASGDPASRMSIGSLLAQHSANANGLVTSPPAKPSSSATPPLFLMTSDSSLSLMLPPEVFASVMDTYFTSIFPTIPIIHRYSLERNPHFYPPALLFAVMAVSVRFNNHAFFDTPAVREQWAECLFQQAHKLLQPLILDPKRVHYHHVIALLHVVNYFFHMKTALLISTRGTSLVFVLLRELRLDEETIAQCPLPRWVQYEEFRRLRWNMYFHDRVLTYGAGAGIRPFALARSSLINMRFPVNDNLWLNGDTTEPVATSAPITLSIFERDLSSYAIFMSELAPLSRMIILFSIFEKIVCNLNGLPGAESKETIAQMLATWYECQPPEDKLLSSTSEPSYGLIYLMIVYHTMVVIIHSPSNLDDMWADESWLLSQDFLVAAEHAGLCTNYLEANPRALQFAPYLVKIFVQRVFCMHLMLAQKLAHEQTFQEDLKRKVKLHIQALAVMGRTDKMSAITAKLLAVTAEGSLGQLQGSVGEVFAAAGFTPEEMAIMADINKDWISERAGFLSQMRSLMQRSVGVKPQESPQPDPEL